MGQLGMEQKGNAPSVSLVFPPVGWHSTLVHEGQTTTICAFEKTVVMAKQPENHEKRVKHEEYNRGTCTFQGIKHTWALDIHKVRVGFWHNALEFVNSSFVGVKEIDGESLCGIQKIK